MRPTVAFIYILGSAVGFLACGGGDDQPPETTPTWYRDVEPIVQVHCNGCHADGGIGPVHFTPETVVELSGNMAHQVQDRLMPPWPPSTLGPPLLNPRSLPDDQIATIAAWAAGGAPLGDPADHGELAPVTTFGLTDPDYSFTIPEPYDPDRRLQDDIRCFVIDLPFTSNTWLRALRFNIDQRAMVHHLGAGIATGANKVAAHQLDDTEVDATGVNRPGYACAGGLRIPVSSGLGIGGPGAEGYEYTGGDGILIPGDSAILLTVHYYTPGAPVVTDSSGVDIWVSDVPLRPMGQTKLQGPSELPCPGGPSTDPADGCNRDHAISLETGFSQPTTRAIQNDLQRHCGYTPDNLYDGLDFSDPGADQFLVTRQCMVDVPYDGTARMFESHMHTRGFASRIEVLREGAWQPLIDIPRYNWHWEASYQPAGDVALHAGEQLRVTCTFDNGVAAQPPDPDRGGELYDPGYVIAAEGRLDEMCGATVWIERAPRGAPTICGEAKQIFDGACPGLEALSTTIWGGACDGNAEVLAANLMATPDADISYRWCDIEPAAGPGATCTQTVQCATTCATQACVDACTAAASAVALHRYDRLIGCATTWCAPDQGSQWAACLGVSCGPEYKKCLQ